MIAVVIAMAVALLRRQADTPTVEEDRPTVQSVNSKRVEEREPS